MLVANLIHIFHEQKNWEETDYSLPYPRHYTTHLELTAHLGPVFLVCIVTSDEFTKRLVIKRKSTCAW